MASFSSHKSDISALEAQLASLSRQLEESTQVASSFEDPKDAYDFIDTQERRVRNVEQDFLKATDEILPIDRQNHQVSKQMTVTEMAEVVRSLQEMQTQQLERLLDRLGVNQDSTTAGDQNVPPTHFSIGGPLNPVIETDNETDGTLTTPGSSAIVSPTFWNTQEDSLTPQTPDLYNLNLSESTASVLREQSARKPRTPRQSALNEAYLALEMKLQNEVHQSQLRGDNDHEADVESLIASESSEEEYEYDSVDEGHTMASTVVAQDRYASNRVVSKSYSEVVAAREEDDEDTLDDSALYCPTVLARDHRPPSNARAHHTPARKLPHLSSPSDKPNITHIEVDTELPSPAPTNLTMDMTAFLNETMDRLEPLPESNDDTSVASEETAVLDRYRLDADENSPHGFRVVPNPRGKHSASKSKHMTPCRQAVIPNSTPRSRPKRVFRKTPYPKAKKVPSTPTIDENAPLNVDTSPLFSPTTFSTLTLQNPLASMPSQSVRKSLSFSATKKKKKGRTNSLSPSLLYAKAHLQLMTPKPVSDYTKISIPPLQSKFRLDAVNRNQIKPVTKAEYDEAPRVVQMQVSLEEVQSAISALNQALGLYKASLQFLEKEANRILQPHGFDERKSKSILMSLCHWRRLLMRRPSGDQQSQGIVFDVICN